MRFAVNTFLAAVAALVLILVLFVCKSIAAEPLTYTTPTGACHVYELGTAAPLKALVICGSIVPDMTGDGIPEQEYRLLETRRYGRLSCGSSIIIDTTCPTNGACRRYLWVDRTCF